MKIFPLIFLIALVFSASCGSSNTSTPDGENNKSGFDSTSVTMGITPDRDVTTWKGTLINAVQWKDNNGLNTMIFSGKEAYLMDSEEELRRADFYAVCYATKENVTTKLWEITDFVDHCYCDCAVSLQMETITVKDIDGDGVAENLFLYKLNDRCDASPVASKLMMHSGAVKLVIRGYTDQFVGPAEEEMNRFRAEQQLPPVKYKQTDPAFDQHNPAFKAYASGFWDQYIKQEEIEFNKQQSEPRN